MKNFKYIAIGFIVLLICGISALAVPGSAVASKYSREGFYPRGFSELAEEAGPAVVNIRTEKTVKGGGFMFPQFERGPSGQNDPWRDLFEKFYGQQRQREFKRKSLGSGFIIDKKGYIVTNNHVVENADEIKVVLKNGKEYDAEVVGRDSHTDIALIKINSADHLPALKLGNSDKLRVGEWVIAIGNPFGLDHTVTAGIVSAKGRVIQAGPYDDFIQTDASINPGNSGGPLINMDGEVVGINTMIVAGGQGIGFAIPINLAGGILEQLKDSGEVIRGWLGVSIQDVSEDLAEYYGIEMKKGALVAEVFQGDPADEAGIKPKDIIIAVNGERVESSRDLTAKIADLKVGEKAKIQVLRDGKKKNFRVKINKRPDSLSEYGNDKYGRNQRQEEEGMGIRVSEITPEMAKRLNIDKGRGVLVVSVKPGSKGEQAGIRKGDVIFEINRREINSIGAYQKALREVGEGETVAYLIKRRGAGLAVVQLKK